MILSVSRRTDIPAFYADWFLGRIRAGYVLVRNPMRFHHVSRISLAPADVDFIAFWTKNPVPLMPGLAELSAYDYGFQYTITGYGAPLEPGVPDLAASLAAFRTLSERLGPDRVVWRYDPILFTAEWTMDRHRSQFARIACALAGHTRRCVISFLDVYVKGAAALRRAGVTAPTEADAKALAPFLAETADRCGMTVETCAEPWDLSSLGILPGHCLQPAFTGVPLTDRDKGQRPLCGCQPSTDIGAYHSCPHKCVYCYANHGDMRIVANLQQHDPRAPFLLGNMAPEDIITDRKR